MFKSLVLMIILVSGLVLLDYGMVLAQENEPQDNVQQEKIQTPDVLEKGVIAGNERSRSAGSEVSAPTRGSAPGDDLSPIVASVSRSKRDECVITIRNISKDATYQLNYQFEVYDESSVRFHKFFAARVKPDETVIKTISACLEGNTRLVLKSGKKV